MILGRQRHIGERPPGINADRRPDEADISFDPPVAGAGDRRGQPLADARQVAGRNLRLPFHTLLAHQPEQLRAGGDNRAKLGRAGGDETIVDGDDGRLGELDPLAFQRGLGGGDAGGRRLLGDQIFGDLLVGQRTASLNLTGAIRIGLRLSEIGLGGVQCRFLLAQQRLSFRHDRADIDKHIGHAQPTHFRGNDGLVPGFQPAARRHGLRPLALGGLCRSDGQRGCFALLGKRRHCSRNKACSEQEGEKKRGRSHHSGVPFTVSLAVRGVVALAFQPPPSALYKAIQ